MNTLLLTVILASIIMMGGVFFMAIGWLITGKSKLTPGACGKDPTKKQEKNEDCGNQSSCSLCKNNKFKKE